MKRLELEVAIRAASRIASDTEFFLIGSQAVHAYCRKVPAEVLISQECDLYPKNQSEAAHLLDIELGRSSTFARQHGFYVDVVTPEIANLPQGWERRLKQFRVGKIKVYCLEAHDLIISKLAAGRLRDLEFTASMFQLRLAAVKRLKTRIQRYPVEHDRPLLLTRLESVLRDMKGR